MEADHLGNIYGITPDGYLKKFNASGDSIAAWYNVKAWGAPTAVDVSNPMRIMLYYRPFATIVVLDRLLVQRNQIDLRRQQIFSVMAMANAYDNNIWIFDEQEFKLKKIDEQGSVTFESADWRMLFPETPVPVCIMDMHNLVYLYDPNKGIYSFDYYGSYKKMIPAQGLNFTGMNNGFIYGVKNKELKKINVIDGGYDPVNVTLSSADQQLKGLRFMNDCLYLLTDSGIIIQKQKKP